ncbi:MAG: DUF5947 family protein [Actinomycetes bacterium]
MTTVVGGRSGNPMRRLLDAPPPTEAVGERCEMCAEPIAVDHGHLVDLRARSLMCTCRGCTLLFSNPGAGSGRFRIVPDRYLSDPAFVLDDAGWDRLQIPVRMAFFLRNSELERVVGFYPSPAGATECELPMDGFEQGLGRSPLAAMLEPDVEALLARGDRGNSSLHLVPVDACYELVGLVRLTWKGFDGGADARTAIDGFFGRLADRSRAL